jgi:C4-dicarboxylate-specific signal transduction histidine kinase
VPPRYDCFDLNQAIEEVIGLAQGMITEHGVSLQTPAGKRNGPRSGDRVQLQQVVPNLILNAVEAMSSVGADERKLLSTARNPEWDGSVSLQIDYRCSWRSAVGRRERA